MKDFFVSFNKSDEDWARWIVWQLEAAGYTTVSQLLDFPPGSNWAVEIQKGLNQTRHTLLVLSPSFLRSRYARAEAAATWVRDPLGKKRAVIPVRVRKCSPRGWLKSIEYVDLVGLDDEVAAQTKLLNQLRQTRAPMPAAAPADRPPAQWAPFPPALGKSGPPPVIVQEDPPPEPAPVKPEKPVPEEGRDPPVVVPPARGGKPAYQPCGAPVMRGLPRVIDTWLRQPDSQAALAWVNLWAGRGGGKSVFLDQMHYTLQEHPSHPDVQRFDGARMDEIESHAQSLARARRGEDPTVLLVDNVDAGDLDAFEQKVVRKLLRKRVLLLTTSHRPLLEDRRDSEVRRCFQPEECLPPLTYEEVEQYVLGTKIKEPYKKTLGVPKFLEWLCENQGMSEEGLMHRAAAFFLDPLPPEVARKAAQCSIFMAFDDFVLRKVFPELERGGLYTGSVHETIGPLRRAQLITKPRDEQLYTFQDPAMRHVLAYDMLYRRPDEFRARHEAARNSFQTEANQGARYLHPIFVPTLYHTAWAASLNGGAAPGDACVGWFQDRLASKEWQFGVRWNEISQSLRTCGGDWAAHEELRELLGQSALNTINRLINDQVKREQGRG